VIGLKSPPGWSVLAENNAGKVLENPTVAARVFVPTYVGHIRDPARQIQLLEQIGDFRTHGIVERGAEAAADSGAWIANGRATVRITQYTAQDIRLEIEAREPAVIASSIPAWPGWRVSLDGRDTPTAHYNLAFLSFRVPAGQHEARIRYWPAGIADGLRVSGLTLILSVLLLFRNSRSSRLPRGAPGIGDGSMSGSASSNRIAPNR